MPLRKIGLLVAVLALLLNIFLIFAISVFFPDGRDPNAIDTFTPTYLELLATLLVLVMIFAARGFTDKELTPARRIAVVRNLVIGGFVLAVLYHCCRGSIANMGIPSIPSFLIR